MTKPATWASSLTARPASAANSDAVAPSVSKARFLATKRRIEAKQQCDAITRANKPRHSKRRAGKQCKLGEGGQRGVWRWDGVAVCGAEQEDCFLKPYKLYVHVHHIRCKFSKHFV